MLNVEISAIVGDSKVPAYASLLLPLASISLDPVPTLLFGLAASVAGIVGDLVESLVKRECGVKDSSGLLPGHGGILDRVDALLVTGPVVYLYALWAVGC